MSQGKNKTSKLVKMFSVANQNGENQVSAGIPTIRGQQTPVLAHVYRITNPDDLVDLHDSPYFSDVFVTSGILNNGKISLIKEPLHRARRAIVWVQLLETDLHIPKLIKGKGTTVSYDHELGYSDAGIEKVARNTVIEVGSGGKFSVRTTYKLESKRPEQVYTYKFNGKEITPDLKTRVILLLKRLRETLFLRRQQVIAFR